MRNKMLKFKLFGFFIIRDWDMIKLLNKTTEDGFTKGYDTGRWHGYREACESAVLRCPEIEEICREKDVRVR